MEIMYCLDGRQWSMRWKGLGSWDRVLEGIGRCVSSGVGGKRIWDPGGARAESLSTAGRRRARWAGGNVQERSELGELAGRQAFGF